MTLQSLIKKLKFDYITDIATDKNFPDDGRRGTVELLNFDEELTDQEVFAKIKEKGYRPATIHELLIWAEKNWEKETVIAFGSIYTDADGGRRVLSVWRGGAERRLLWRWLYPSLRWCRVALFAGVRELELETLESKNLGTLESRVSALEEQVSSIKKFLVF